MAVADLLAHLGAELADVTRRFVEPTGL